MFTFQDQLERIADTFTFDWSVNNSDAGRIVRLARKAIGQAYTDFSAKATWNYLRRQGQVVLRGAYQEGTIEYDPVTHIATLTDGVWPLNSDKCEILINRNIYEVQTRIDDTHIKLVPDLAPIDPLPPGTSYVIVQTQYELPEDFVTLRGITEIERFWRLTYLSPEAMLAFAQWWFGPCNSWYFTVVGAGYSGGMYLQFAPPPSNERTFSFIYQAKPRPRSLTRMYSTGRVALTEDSTTVTLTNGVFPSKLARNCVFRLGNGTVPTGIYGDNPYVFESLIASRASDTEIELLTPATATVSNQFYCVDDPLDFEPMAMMTAFDRLCEVYLLRLHQASTGDIQDALVAYDKAIIEARAADSRTIPMDNPTPGIPVPFGEALFWTGNVQR